MFIAIYMATNFFLHKYETVFFINFTTKILLISKSEIKNLLLIYIRVYLFISYVQSIWILLLN